MPTKPTQHAEVNQAVAGLITEASPLNFPSQASADEVNFELFRTGLRKRRLGMDLEDGYAKQVVLGGDLSQLDTAGSNSFVWQAAGGDTSNNFVVIQLGRTIWIYNWEVANISPNGPVAIIDVSNFQATATYSFAATEGILVIAAGSDTIATVTYSGNNVFSLDYMRLLTRDVWGIEETIDANYEKDLSYRGSINPQHQYNLWNQSWGIPRKDQYGNPHDPLFMFRAALGLNPSNSEQVWAGLQYQAVGTGQQPFERLYLSLFDDSLGAKVSSAKGYFIIDALARGSSRRQEFYRNKEKYPTLIGDVNPPDDFTSGGASCVAEFAGRIFYAGFQGNVTNGDKRSPNLLNYVFFSQLVKSRQDINRCYQDGDPTSRDSSDVVDTDGGFVRIAGAERIIAMKALGINLVVVATNGIWMITGGTTDSGFSATNYKAVKVSNFGGLSPNSVVVVNDAVFLWSSDGIYQISRNQLGDYGAQSITLNRIQSLYEDIPNTAKAKCFGDYDQINKKIRWVYKTGSRENSDLMTYELVFDITTAAFTQNIINNLNSYSTEIIGIFQTALTVTATGNIFVYDQTDAVVADSESVVVTGTDNISNQQFLRYTTIVVDNNIPYLSFSYYHQDNFRDWYFVNGTGVDAKAYCLTGDVIGGDSSVDKQVPYLVMHFVRTEDGVDSQLVPLKQSSCLYRGQWNFANSVNSNKWSPLRQAYRYRKPQFVEDVADIYDNGFEVVTTKNKLRGKGKAFALYFETEEGKDCQIIGWNISINANQAS